MIVISVLIVVAVIINIYFIFFYCRMSIYDRQYFLCDSSIVNWEKYYIIFALGARVHLVRDSLENYDSARVRMKWMKLAHYTIKYLCLGFVGSILYFILF